ncbi:hypothetical protein SEA_VIBAKI_3 [Arthrobacter phage Vibaki]|uniref:Uncharacterized protein n=1 Tax=Arthrobacter phage Vibaki TaxID=2593333 RepID=A0A514TYW0_9CAUD|nr:hypothetical protein HYP95_gp03 [Arthrobacter phage Vibaki]QDK01884.1 hypothetical protein SEA_VIBAKI_3 [Arthrobacter phage Vibaki]
MSDKTTAPEPKPIYWVWTRRSWSSKGQIMVGVQIHEFDTQEKQEQFMKNTTKHVTEYGTR